MVFLGKIFSLFDRFVQREIRQYEKTKFKSIGKSCIFTHENILIGDGVHIPVIRKKRRCFTDEEIVRHKAMLANKE